jgi:FixJ family two-component response regulator
MNIQPVVFVVDDDPQMLRLVACVLSGEGFAVETYCNCVDFLDACQPSRRGCLLLDIQMPGVTGPQLQRQLSARGIDLPVIFLTATADVSTTVELMKQGAIDLLQKPFEVEKLVASVRRGIEIDATAHAAKVRRDAIQSRLQRLTPREHEVMKLVVTGRANKQIAYELKLSEKTVEIHRSRVMKKMEAESVAELVRQCIDGLVGPITPTAR